MKSRSLTPIHALLLFALVFTSLTLADSAAAETKEVAVVPFSINADKDMTYLQDGIFSMLESRLTWADKVRVIPRSRMDAAVQNVQGPVNEGSARKLAAGLGADYVLFGSLTIFGESVSVDAKMLDVTGARPPLSFFNQSQGMGEVIPRINQFAQEINEKIFGRRSASYAAADAARPTVQGDIYAHPEKLVRGRMGDPGSPFIMSAGAGESPGFSKSRSMRFEVVGMAMGDVDGDGKNETVLIDNNTVYVYRNGPEGFIRLAAMSGNLRHKYLSVDVADIKKDNRAEIFVTAFHKESKNLESFVLEWDGKGFQTIVDKQNWYFRVTNHPAFGFILAGQRKGSSDLFYPGIYELMWKDDHYVDTEMLALPPKANIFNFAIGDITNTKIESVLIFNVVDRLQLLTAGGAKEWTSDDRYGGSEKYIDFDATAEQFVGESNPEEPDNRTFLPHRIFATDLNHNGKTEITVVINSAATSRLFERYRRYHSGQIANLTWDGLGLAPNWHTRKISGYIADFGIGDIDNDDKPEIAAAIVSRREVIGQTPKSVVVIYDLDALESMGEKNTEEP